MSKTILSLITILALGTTSIQAQEKDIGVVASTHTQATSHTSARHSSHTRNYDDTIIYASAAKKHYSVDEPIQIRLKLKRDAYIYFWTVASNGEGYLILPNDFESFNKYKKRKAYVVPERSADYDFISDRAGVEKVYVLATDKKISSRKISQVFSQKVGGIIPKASSKSINDFMTKDIKVIARNQKLNYDLVDFSIEVHDKNPRNNTSITINRFR